MLVGLGIMVRGVKSMYLNSDPNFIWGSGGGPGPRDPNLKQV